MNYLPSVCPHDCPSTCALEVERLDKRTIGRIRGAKSNSYTAGVICAKVARYSERVHHPKRLLAPLLRAGAKGAGEFAGDFGTAWEGTKRIDNKYDPREYAAAGTAYALEGIGAGFD